MNFLIRADAVSAFAFGVIKRGIRHFDEFDRIMRIVRKRSHPDADRYAMRSGKLSSFNYGKFTLFNRAAKSFRRDNPLRGFGIEQKCSKFLAAETCGNIARSQILRDTTA